MFEFGLGLYVCFVVLMLTGFFWCGVTLRLLVSLVCWTVLVVSFLLCSSSSSVGVLCEFDADKLWWVYMYDLLRFCVLYTLR